MKNKYDMELIGWFGFTMTTIACGVWGLSKISEFFGDKIGEAIIRNDERKKRGAA